jgi:hypothetical protein
MFRAINAHLQEVTLYTCSIWYRHSLRAVVVADRREVIAVAETWLDGQPSKIFFFDWLAKVRATG